MIKRNLSIRYVLILFMLFIGVVLVLYPLFWMVVSSLKTYNEIYQKIWGFPEVAQFHNYVEAWQKGISRYFFNSVLVSVVTIIFVLAIASLCAFGLSRYKFKFSKVVLLACMGGLMLNSQICLIPIYSILTKLHIRNTYWAMILPYVTFRMPISVLLIRSYFLDIPHEIEESARMDGCKEFIIFSKIFIPISRPILATCTILTAFYSWNEFLFAVIFIDSEKYKTIPSGLMSFRDALSTNWGVMLAGMTIAALPLIALFIVMQKQFVHGITAGAVKG